MNPSDTPDRQPVNTYARGESDDRPWGRWEVLDAGAGFCVKRITVNPGGRLSLQKHHHRAEHWIIVAGTARVTNDERTYDLPAREATYIPLGAVHRLENPGPDLLEMIEVQVGDRLDENDIVRLEDSYRRG